jgi:ankyrin repeat protein
VLQARGVGANRIPGGCTPLHSAAGYAYADCVTALLDKGANPRAKDDVRAGRIA